MVYHPNPKVHELLAKLLDALSEDQHNAGRGSMFVLIPHNPGERIVLAQDGKLLACDEGDVMQIALGVRKEREKRLQGQAV